MKRNVPKRMAVDVGWVGKSDWENFNFSNGQLPKILKNKGRKRDYKPEDWPPVKIFFEARITV